MSRSYIFQYQNFVSTKEISVNLYTQYESYDVMIDKIGHVTQLSSNFPISHAYTNSQLNIIIPNTNPHVQKKYTIKLNDDAEINFITNASENQELQTKLLSELINRCGMVSKSTIKYPKILTGAKATAEQLLFFSQNYSKLTSVYKQEILKTFDQNYRGQNLTVYFKQYPNKLESFANYAFNVNQLNYQNFDMFDHDNISTQVLDKLQIKYVVKKFKIENQFDIFNYFEQIYNKFLGKQSFNKRINTTSITLQQLHQSLDFLYNKTKYFYLQGVDQLIKIDKFANASKTLQKSTSSQIYNYNNMLEQIYNTVGLNYQATTYKYCNLDLLFLPIIIRMFLKKDEQITNLTLNIPFQKISQLKQNIIEIQKKQSIYDQLKSHAHIFSLFQKIIKATKQSNLDFAISTLLQLRTKMQKKVGNEIDNVFSKNSVLVNHQLISQCINDYSNFKLLNIILIKFLVIYQTTMYGVNEIFKQSDNYKSQLCQYQIDLLTISKYLTIYDQIILLQKALKEYAMFKRNQQAQTRFQWFVSQIICIQSLIKMQRQKKQYNQIKKEAVVIQKFAISQRKRNELIKLATQYYQDKRRLFNASNYIFSFYKMKKQFTAYQRIRNAAKTIQKYQNYKQIKQQVIYLSIKHLKYQKSLYASCNKIQSAINKYKVANLLIQILKQSISYKINKMKQIIILQSYARMYIQKKQFQININHVRQIQKSIQQWKKDTEFIQRATNVHQRIASQFQAAWAIQYYAQCHFIENKLVEGSKLYLKQQQAAFNAAIKLQSYYKMLKQQKLTSNMKSKCAQIQKCFKNIFTNKIIQKKAQQYYKTRQQEFSAVSRIIEHIRELYVERAKIKIAKQYLDKRRSEYHSSIKIQSTYRRIKCQREYRNILAKIALIQQKSKNIHFNNKLILLAAIYYANLFNMREDAAKTIQWYIRRQLRYNNMIALLKLELSAKQQQYQAVMLIQRNTRRLQVQQKMQKFKSGVVVIQCHIKQYILINNAQKIYDEQHNKFLAVKRIQRAIVTRKIIILAKNHYAFIQKQLLNAQCLISSCIRMHQQRKRYLNALAQYKTIQKNCRNYLQMKKIIVQIIQQVNATKCIQRYIQDMVARQQIIKLAEQTYAKQVEQYNGAVQIQSAIKMHQQRLKYNKTLQQIQKSQQILRPLAKFISYKRFMIQEAEDLLLLKRQFYEQVLKLQRAIKRVKRENNLFIQARDYCIEQQQRLNAATSIQQIYRAIVNQRKRKEGINKNDLISTILPAVMLIQKQWHHQYQIRLQQRLEDKLVSENSITSTISPDSNLSALGQSLTANNSDAIIGSNEQKQQEDAQTKAAISIQRFIRRDKYFKNGISLSWFKYKLKSLVKAYRDHKHAIYLQKQNNAKNAQAIANNKKQTLLQQLDTVIKVILQASNPLTQQNGWEKVLLAFTLNPKLIKEKLVYKNLKGNQTMSTQSFALYYALFASINQLNKGASDPGVARYALQLYKLSVLFMGQLPQIIKHNYDIIPNNNITELYCKRQRFDHDFMNRYYINMKFLATYTRTPQIEAVGMQLLKNLKRYYAHFYSQLSCVKQKWIKIQ